MGELDALQVREEVLQAMYWMRAEGLAEDCSPGELARFLAVREGTLAPYLERFAREGWVEERGGRYVLSDRGTEAGKRTFAEEFAGMTGSSHGECDADCWCHDSPEEAARCLEDRAGHAHSH
jgi:Mn-dependent DtxR family transcriptional regulator